MSLTGKGNSINARIAVFAISLFTAFAVLISMTGTVFAYPTGWTSDVTVVPSGADNGIDIAGAGSTIYIAYINSSDGNAPYIARSADNGLTWASFKVCSDSGHTPQVSIIGSYVYISFITTAGIEVYRSGDGISYSRYAWVTDASVDYNAVSNLSMTKNDNVAVAYYHHTWGSSPGRERAYWCPITGGNNTGSLIELGHSDGGDNHMSKPSIATDGTKYFIAYEIYDTSGSEDDGIWVAQYDCSSPGSTTADTQVIADSSVSDPDIAYRGTVNRFTMVYTSTSATKSVYYSYYNGTSWGGGSMYDTGSSLTEPYPHATPNNASSAICRIGADVEFVSSGTDYAVMASANSMDNSRALAVDKIDSGNINIAILTTAHSIKFKREGSLSLPQVVDVTPEGGTHYVNGDFFLGFTEVADEWDFASGTIDVDYCDDPEFSFPSDVGTISSPPWTIYVNTTGLNEMTYYFRGEFDDGSLTGTAVAEIVLDKTDPTVDIALANDPVDEWTNEDVTATLSGTDNNFDHIEYRYGSGSWVTYAAPFSVPPGENTLTARSYDKAGNYADTSRTVKIDKAGPDIEISKPAGDYMYADTQAMTYRLGAGCTDTGSGMAKSGFRVDGEKVYETDSGFNMAYVWDVENASEGWHEIEVFAEDNAGNSTTKTKNAYLVKGAAPPEAPDPYDPEYKPSMMDWYFAEGNTYDWFDEYITIMNPSAEETANVTFDFMYDDGQVTPYSTEVALRSRTTVTVKNVPEIRLDADVSIRVRSDKPVVAERPCYFNYQGWSGGHNVVGIDTLYDEYYFAEGTTRSGFDTWLTILNPGDETADVSVNYILGDGRVVTRDIQAGARSRATVNPVTDIGPGQDVSIHITSDQVIAVERPIYFDYNGITDGTNVAGSPVKMKEWNFAEGNTHAWNTEYICIQNVEDDDANIEFEFMLGTGDVINADVVVKAHSRGTFDIGNWVGKGNDVSTRVTSDQPVVAERPMYFTYQGKWDGGTVNLGATSLRTSDVYYLAEGYTGSGFDEWITVMNPSGGSFFVDVVYLSNGGQDGGNRLYLRGYERKTININTEFPGMEVSVILNCESDVVVERPMYFDYHVYTGGHIASGYPWLDN